MTEDRAYRWLISGRVQGVGFRWFVLRRAKELGIRGWASNRADGRVEVIGRGSDIALEDLDDSLRAGPRLARVENVEKIDIPHEVVDTNSFVVK